MTWLISERTNYKEMRKNFYFLILIVLGNCNISKTNKLLEVEKVAFDFFCDSVIKNDTIYRYFSDGLLISDTSYCNYYPDNIICDNSNLIINEFLDIPPNITFCDYKSFVDSSFFSKYELRKDDNLFDSLYITIRKKTEIKHEYKVEVVGINPQENYLVGCLIIVNKNDLRVKSYTKKSKIRDDDLCFCRYHSSAFTNDYIGKIP